MSRSLVSCFVFLISQPVAIAAQTCTEAQAPDRTAIERSFDGLRVCAWTDMLNAGAVSPAEWIGRAPLVVLETQGIGGARFMRMAGSSATFAVNGFSRPIDSVAGDWRAAVVDILDATWRLNRLSGRENALKTELAALRGGPGDSQGIVAAGPRDAVVLRAEVQKLKGEYSALSDEIGRLRRDISDLARDLKDERNSLALAQSQLSSASTQAERNQINQEIQRYSREIRRLQGLMDRLEQQARAKESHLATINVPRRIEKLEREIRAIDMNTRDAAERPAGPDAEAQIAALERQLADLAVERHTRELNARTEVAVQRLRVLLSM